MEISKPMAVNKKEGNTSTKTPEKPIFEFQNIEKVGAGETPNKIFLLVITTMISNFDVSIILIYGGNSHDIMYSNIFEKMGLKKKNMAYESSNL